LDAFLADPQGFAPGNNMGFFGLRDPQARAALIRFLAEKGADPP
jgi:cytochrome c